MPGHILAVYVQNMAKLYTALLVKAEQVFIYILICVINAEIKSARKN